VIQRVVGVFRLRVSFKPFPSDPTGGRAGADPNDTYYS